MACDVIDEQEIGLAMDTYCLVVDPGQATHYGGVLECELSGDALRLRLTVEAAEILGLRSDNIFPLELPEEQHTLLSRGLRRVLSSGRPDAIPARLDV
jgi:hypothetical protein